jgi:hypothetical protein
VEASPNTYSSSRELAYRETDGLEVTLFWNEGNGRLAVAVLDTRTRKYFEVEAARDKALDVFYHPYSYAAARNAPYTNLLLAA